MKVTIYGKQIGATIETQNYAAEIRLRAERRLGEMLMVGSKAEGSKGQLKGRDSSGTAIMEAPEDNTPTLASVGISWKESSRSQELAAVSEAEFEAALGHGVPKKNPK
jgi:hypothetical protein